MQIDGQNLFKDRFSVLFSFRFDHTAGGFRREVGTAEKEAKADAEDQGPLGLG